MRKLFVFVMFLGALSLPLMAQEKLDIFGGYQYLHTGNITIDGTSQPESSQNFNGWNASATYNFTKHLGVAGDFGGAYATISGVSTHVYTYTGGPVLSLDAGGRINPFVHALFGGINLGGSTDGVSVSKTGFTVLAGGGVDVKVNRVLAVRLIQADWLYYHFGSTVEVPSFSQSNNVRISSGVVIRF